MNPKDIMLIKSSQEQLEHILYDSTYMKFKKNKLKLNGSKTVNKNKRKP